MKFFFKKIFHIYSVVSNEAYENHLFAYASQASFFVIISAIPFIMLVFSLLQLFLSVDTSYFISLVNDFFPVQVQKLIIDELNDAYTKVTVSSISLTSVFLVWSASRGVKAISYGLRMVFGTNDKANYWVSTFWSLIYTFLFAVGLIASVVAIVFGKAIADLIIDFFPEIKTAMEWILDFRYIVLLLFMTLIFMSAYKFLGKSKIKFTKQFFGAFLASASWLLFSYFYSLFIANIGRFSYIYGSLAAIIFMMLWTWFCMLIFLFGAEINDYIYSNGNTPFKLIKSVFPSKSVNSQKYIKK